MTTFPASMAHVVDHAQNPNTQVDPAGLITLPITAIVPSRWQPRQVFDADRLLELAQDIQWHGVLTPPIVWSNEAGEYELIAGERRIRACYALCLAHIRQAVGLRDAIDRVAKYGFGRDRDNYGDLITASGHPQSTVPCRLVTGAAADLHELALVDNLQREDLSPLEEAHALHDLLQEYGHTQRELADRLGKSQTWISHRLNLLNLAPDVADQVTAGEVDPHTARELARLAPEVQGAVVTHLQKHDMKSKAAQGFVQKVLDLSDPEHYGTGNSGARLVGIALAELPDSAARQAAVVAAAEKISDGKLTNQLDGRDLLLASGIAGAGKTRYDINVTELWQAHAPAAGYGCSTCQINAHRPIVEEINSQARARKESNLSDVAWPRCAPDVATCRAYSAPGAAVSLALPWFGGQFTPTPEEQSHITDTWPRRADDVQIWAGLTRRYYAEDDAKAARQHEKEENGLVDALARYLTLQRSGELAPAANSLHQPCNKCIFHKVDSNDPSAHCQFQANPPDWHDYDRSVVNLWTSGHSTIGRCRLFRLKQPELNLPELPGGIDMDPATLLYLLRRMSDKENYGSSRSGPRWIDAKRAQVQHAPPWSNCEPVLARLIPQLSRGRRLAVLMLWEDPFVWNSSTYGAPAKVEAYVPELGRVVPYTLMETISR